MASVAINPFPLGFGGVNESFVPEPGQMAQPRNPQPATQTPAPVANPLTVPRVAARTTDVTDMMAKSVLFVTKYGIIGNSKKVAGGDVLETDADKSLLRVSKQLLNSPELDAIRKADTGMRTYVYNSCHPFESGVYLLPVGLIETTVAKCDEYARTRAGLVDAFIEAYPRLCEQASRQLGSLYESRDYPNAETIRGRFSFDYSIRTFSTPGQLRTVSADMYQREVRKAEQQIRDAAREITALMRQELSELVNHLSERLTPGDDGKPRILKTTAVSNLQEFLAVFDLKNVTDDRELAQVVEHARGLLKGVTRDHLANSDLFRERIRNGMETVTAQLSAMVAVKPGRIFRDE